MSQSVISDNWSLQIINELLTEGMDSSDTQYITIDRNKDSYGYKNIASAVIYIEALFDLITDIILRDQILVDEEFAHVWKENDSPLLKAEDSGVIRAYPFLIDPEKLVEPRNEFVSRLCVTSDLKHDHEENETGWEMARSSPHAYLSQTLWGGAGMLARGFVYEKGYTPHPVRKRFFIDAGIALSSKDSVLKINNLIKEKRTALANSSIGDDELYSLTININPLPLHVFQESNSTSDLISVALQFREEYQELRDWLGTYQQALSDGSYEDKLKFEKIVRSISKYIDSRMGIVDPNSSTFTIGIDVLKVAIKGQPLNALKNQFGVRSMINNLILGRTGHAELKKFLNFFGHKNTTVGMKVLEYFAK